MWLHRTSYQQGLRNIWHDQDRACRTTHLLTPPQALLSFLQPKTAHPRKQMVQNKQQLASITDPEFNVVWWPRAWDTNRAQAVVDATRAVGLFKEQVVVDRNGAQSLAQQVEQLFPHGAADPLHALLADDVCNIVDIYLDVLGYAQALVKLETVTKTTCSRWHADHVPVRCLVTYAGAGTQFVENQHVHRKQLLLQLGVQDTGGYALRKGAHVDQAGVGDVLLLKGHAFDGFEGKGAAHRSPDGASVEHPRLLLTIDAVDCGCC